MQGYTDLPVGAAVGRARASSKTTSNEHTSRNTPARGQPSTSSLMEQLTRFPPRFPTCPAQVRLPPLWGAADQTRDGWRCATPLCEGVTD